LTVRRGRVGAFAAAVLAGGILGGALPLPAVAQPLGPAPAGESTAASACRTQFQDAVAEAIALRTAAAEDRDVRLLRDAAAELKTEAGKACPDAAAWLPPLQRERGMLLRLAATDEADLAGLADAVLVLEGALPDQKQAAAAATENELGLAKRLLGQANKDMALLGDSVAHYRRALAAFEGAGDDANAGTVRWNLAVALRILGQGTSDQSQLEEAAALFGAVLISLDRRQKPREWSAAQANLGQTLLALGEAGNNMDALSRSVAALELALEDAQSDGRPLREWAETQNALANALQVLGEREWSAELLEAALKARRNASVLYDAAGLEAYRFYFETRIAAQESLIEVRKTEPVIASTAPEDGTPAAAGTPR
jgi:hypothetical protein